MKVFKIFCMSYMLCFVLGNMSAEAKSITLRCSPGYSVNITIRVHRVLTQSQRELGEVSSYTKTLSCPPDQTIQLIEDVEYPYDGLHANWDMTDPVGVNSNGVLPPRPGPFDPTPGEFAVWGVHPLAPKSYICNSRTCDVDPIAPTFIQPGEFVIGSYDDNATFDLTTVVLDANTTLPIPNASVTIHRNIDSSQAAQGITEPSGRSQLSLNAGDTYYIEVESSGYFPQRSDSFQIFRDHEWRMLLTSGAAMTTANEDVRGAYAGFGLGNASPEANGFDSAVGWKIFAGYEINVNFSLEGGYTSFGEMDGPIISGVSTSIEPTGFELAAVGRYPINDRLSFLGKLGFLAWDFKVNGAGIGSASTTGTDIFFGLAGEYNLPGNLGVRVAWDRYTVEDDNVDLLSASVVYSFK